MSVYRNKNWTKRDYECTNVVACQADSAPSADWIECDMSMLDGLTLLHITAGVGYYGYL